MAVAVGVFVGVLVGVAVGVFVFVGVGVFVFVGVLVGVLVGVFVLVGVRGIGRRTGGRQPPRRIPVRIGFRRRVVAQIHRVATIGIHHPDFIVAAAVRVKDDFARVHRPDRAAVATGDVGNALWVAAIGIHDVNLIVAVAVAAKGDLGAIRRPHGARVVEGIVGEGGHVAPEVAGVNIHDIDLFVAVAVADKENLVIRRPNRHTRRCRRCWCAAAGSSHWHSWCRFRDRRRAR